VVDIPAMTRSMGLAEPAALAQLTRALRDLHPAVVQTHSSKAGVLGRLAAAASRAPRVVHTVHGWSFRDTQPAAVRRGLALLERGLAITTDRLVVVTEADQRIGLRHHIGRSEKYRVIHSGVDLGSSPQHRGSARCVDSDCRRGSSSRMDQALDPSERTDDAGSSRHRGCRSRCGS
jgi:hypothetical protein